MSDDTLQDKALQIAKGLADKPVLLLEVYRLLGKADPKPKVAGPWTPHENRRDLFYRYDILSNGAEAAVIEDNDDQWKWAVRISDGDFDGSAPNLKMAVEVVEHFLAKDGWTVTPSIVPLDKRGEEEEADPEVENFPQALTSNAYQNPTPGDDDDIPF